jgi:hypothetical protein
MDISTILGILGSASGLFALYLHWRAHRTSLPNIRIEHIPDIIIYDKGFELGQRIRITNIGGRTTTVTGIRIVEYSNKLNQALNRSSFDEDMEVYLEDEMRERISLPFHIEVGRARDLIIRNLEASDFNNFDCQKALVYFEVIHALGRNPQRARVMAFLPEDYKLFSNGKEEV